MQYFHVFIKHMEEKGEEREYVYYNVDEEYLRERVSIPYMTNRKFWFLGKIVDPLRITLIVFFQSKKRYENLVLPNGKSPIEQKFNYVVKCFWNYKVKDVFECTSAFITMLPEEKSLGIPTGPLGKKEKVFIVHGRDETQALRLQKYLSRKLKIDATMFEDFKEGSSSNTIIEQLEYVKDNAGYAFVIVTPDDLGCLRENIDKCRTTMLVGRENVTVKSVCEILDNLHARARQNVVFEHGLFIGALGRDRVCCLLQEDTKEKPSDIDGVLYVCFKESVKETFTEIAEKLKKVGLVKT